MDIKDKKVLLLCPPFYGYEKEIVSKLKELGADVKFVEDHPKEWYITLVEVMHKLGLSRSWFVKHYESKILRQIGTQKFDYVLIINGPYLTSWFTSVLRKNHLKSSDSKIVIYYWDSLKNMNDDRNRWNDTNAIFVFDNMDYKENLNRVKFLPLFYCDKYWMKEQKTPECDVMIIGSFRLNRYNFIKDLEAKNPDIKVRSYLYHSKWGFIFHKVFRTKYNHVKYEDLQYKKISFREVVDLYSKSKAVVDIPMPGQRGLTIRTIETLAMHKKIITTNEHIKEYDFYNPQDIFVLSTEELTLPNNEWFDHPFSVSDEIIKQYSIEKWLCQLLGYGND